MQNLNTELIPDILTDVYSLIYNNFLSLQQVHMSQESALILFNLVVSQNNLKIQCQLEIFSFYVFQDTCSITWKLSTGIAFL